MRESPEGAIAILNVAHADLAQAVERELLHRERRQHAAEDDRPAQLAFVVLRAGSEITEKTAGKGVASAGRIENILERIRRHCEDGISRDHQHAVLAAFDHDRLWAEGQDGAGAFDEIDLAGELASLSLVDDDQIDLAKRGLQRWTRRRD